MRFHPRQILRAQLLRHDMTDAERKLWYRLSGRELGFKFRRQVPIGDYIADFACPAARLVIEVDGDSHGNDEAEAADLKRTAHLNRCGYRIIRFWNNEIHEGIDAVVEAIWLELYGGADNHGGAPPPAANAATSPFEGEECVPGGAPHPPLTRRPPP